MKLLLPNFSHIYIEKDAFDYPLARNIINKLKLSKIIEITHYKNVFNRPRQDLILQKKSLKLILAIKKNNFYYPLPDMCIKTHDQAYYTNIAINCIFDCEYCFLKGMYVSSNIVIYVNVEDFFNELKILAKDKEIYIALSYETDLLALDGLTGLVRSWLNFLRYNPNIIAEIRTKSPVTTPFCMQKPIPNVIISYTLLPEVLSMKYEKKIPSLNSRINAIKTLQERGWHIRLAFDPIFYHDGFEVIYKRFFQDLFSKIHQNIYDIHIGVFRIGKDLLKRAIKNFPHNPVFNYPFVLHDSYYTYPKDLVNYMSNFIIKELTSIHTAPVRSYT